MKLVEVDEDLMITAAAAIVGPERTQLILGMYELLSKAAKAGYDLGQAYANEDIESRLADAWDAGFNTGVEEADDSYIQGVADARARPGLADERVINIINEKAKHAINGEYDPDWVQDSGDVTD